MIYFNLISPQFVGDFTVRCMRTFPTTARLHYEVQKRQICAGGAAAISVYTDRVSHARGIARPLRGQCDAHNCGAIFTQELPVVIKL